MRNFTIKLVSKKHQNITESHADYKNTKKRKTIITKYSLILGPLHLENHMSHMLDL